ncbi:COX15/CtaA family protein [Dokdonella sp.]|uniref:COX15/CtaA family protein n=1 Tax=Dokdonella sp. TaxID=2291710 RepID=UPI001B1118BF|nr:COX15/CtaA family protein [Dokdonella sp.]MBO9661903.1 COX15/CtaA family protein [Dokdonella sp.]
MSARSLLAPARIAAFATAFAFVVIVFGAFVRLSNAGLSCPDWPTCYGKATWPGHEHEIEHANASFPERPVETHKAWREQVHRMIAGTLGLLVFALALAAAWRRRVLVAMLMLAALAAALGVFLYIRQMYAASALLSAIAIALPLLAALRLDRAAPWRAAVITFAVVIFQAMLGMWTVTLLLKPVVVMGHLLGGLLTFSLLGYVALRLGTTQAPTPEQRRLRPMVIVALVLLAAQIALGGWTSANYAALACGADFPKCAGSWWPMTDFREGFVLWRGIGVNYEGGVLDAAARAAIQIAHRIGALVVFGHVLATAVLAWRRGLRAIGALAALLLCTQVALGIANVKLLLPLPVATAHNGVAALLLLSLIALLVRVQSPSAPSPAAASRRQAV